MVGRFIGWKRNGLIALLTGVGLVSATMSTADARWRHRYHHYRYSHHHRVFHHHAAIVSESPSFAAMVVDANSGRTLYAVNENAPRHPASITKVMTLYLLFEQLEKGRFSLDSEIPVSRHASLQAPSKLGLHPGDTISVEDAIKAIVTKSANDIAVAVAEAVGGNESDFAELMTRKARELGMSRTTYVNASGLPAAEQITTARDLTILGRAIQERFPKYYAYFSTHSFTYEGETMRNHNHLLGRVEGMDGIKTGYTRASGFNLLTSVKRDDHRIVSAVLGGRTAAARDRIMASLIEDHIDEGSTTRTAVAIVNKAGRTKQTEDQQNDDDETTSPVAAAPAATPVAAPVVVAALAPAPVERAKSETPAVKPQNLAIMPSSTPHVQLAALNPQIERQVERARPAVISGAPKPEARDTTSEQRPHVTVQDGSTSMRATTTKLSVGSNTTPSALGWVAGPQGRAAPASTAIDNAVSAKPMPIARPKETITVARNDAYVPPTSGATTGWMIQIGATDDPSKATALLTKARSENQGALASARPFTEKVQTNDGVLYRARFAGLDNGSAEAACKSLKKSGFSCFTTKN